MGVLGYKVFNPDWTCREFQYEVGKSYEHKGEIGICEAGFHFCLRLIDCFTYYSFDKNNKVAEVEAFGRVQVSGNKCVTNKIKIVKELDWLEVLEKINIGRFCEGKGNTADCNTGHYNTGGYNKGDRNTGSWNEGYRNTGSQNYGNYNTQVKNLGDFNSGSYNIGNFNAGDSNIGDFNTGNRNGGNFNCFIGNLGSCNNGNYNVGKGNRGSYNQGNSNLGCWNLGNQHFGFFNTSNQPFYLFDKVYYGDMSDISIQKGLSILAQSYNNNIWIPLNEMTDEEKKEHPESIKIGGYLKVLEFKDACKLMWNGLTDEEKEEVQKIPNFDKKIFAEITGIVIE